METQKKHIFDFDSDMSFSNVTEEKLIDYQYFLQNTLDFKNSTIHKQFSLLKRFLRWCRIRNYIQTNVFEHFSPKLKTTQKKIIFLTQTRIKTSYKLHDSPK